MKNSYRDNQFNEENLPGKLGKLKNKEHVFNYYYYYYYHLIRTSGKSLQNSFVIIIISKIRQNYCHKIINFKLVTNKKK